MNPFVSQAVIGENFHHQLFTSYLSVIIKPADNRMSLIQRIHHIMKYKLQTAYWESERVMELLLCHLHQRIVHHIFVIKMKMILSHSVEINLDLYVSMYKWKQHPDKNTCTTNFISCTTCITSWSEIKIIWALWLTISEITASKIWK